MLEDRVLIHSICNLEDDSVDLFEAAEGVDWTAVSLRSLEEILRPRVFPLVWVLSWTTSASARGGRISQFAVWAF